MSHHASRFALAAGVLALFAAPAQAQVGRPVTFSKDVLPIFQKHCTICHGVEERGGLKLDSFDRVLLGGTKGPSIVQGQPAASRLVQLIEARTPPKMPPNGPMVPAADRAIIRSWIQQGAANDGEAGPPAAAKPLAITAPKVPRGPPV